MTVSRTVHIRRIQNESKIYTKNGYTLRYKNTIARFIEEEIVGTAITFPCEDEKWNKYVRTGRLYMLGTG